MLYVLSRTYLPWKLPKYWWLQDSIIECSGSLLCVHISTTVSLKLSCGFSCTFFQGHIHPGNCPSTGDCRTPSLSTLVRCCVFTFRQLFLENYLADSLAGRWHSVVLHPFRSPPYHKKARMEIGKASVKKVPLLLVVICKAKVKCFWTVTIFLHRSFKN